MTEEALQIKNTDQGIEVICPGYFDISLADTLHVQLSQLLDEQGKTFIFDVSQVESTDTAILQLVYAFTKTMRDRGEQVIWRSPSETFCSAAHYLGVDDSLGLAC